MAAQPLVSFEPVYAMTKHALITGTRSGIGRALAERLIDMAWTVHGIGRGVPDSLQDHPRYSHMTCDLSELEGVPDAMQSFLAERPGLARFDAVFLNSGQFCEAIRRVSDTPLEELLFLQRLNCFAVKGVLDPLIAAGIEMPICAVSASIAGKRARAGNGGYALSKATLNMLMELYSLEHPGTLFAVIGLCVVDTFLSNKIGTLPLPDDPVFAEQAGLRARAIGSGYSVTVEQRADHLISLLLPRPDPRIVSGKFVEVRELIASNSSFCKSSSKKETA